MQAKIPGKTYEESIEIRRRTKEQAAKLKQLAAHAKRAGKQPVFDSFTYMMFSLYEDKDVDEEVDAFRLWGSPVNMVIFATDGLPGEVVVSIDPSGRTAGELDKIWELQHVLGTDQEGRGRVTAENLTTVITMVRDLRLPYINT